MLNILLRPDLLSLTLLVNLLRTHRSDQILAFKRIEPLSPAHQAKVIAVNVKVNTEIGLFPANIKSVEVIVSDVSCHLPVSFAASFVKNR